MRTKWKIIASLLAIVCVSLLAGGFLGAKFAERAIRHRNTPEAWNQKAMRSLDHRLRLSPEQAERVRRILDGGVEEMKTIRLDTIARADAVVERMLAALEKEITPEQRAEFDKLRKQRGATTLDMLQVEPRKR